MVSAQWSYLLYLLNIRRDWYHSAQTIRKKEEYNGEAGFAEDSDEDVLSFSQTTLDEVPEDGEAPAKPAATVSKSTKRVPAHEAATKELYRHEVMALLSCFLFPLLGAFLLHTIRAQLSRPSEGLVSNYNLTIFLLASEIRPTSHLVKLIQSRTLHLQRVVSSNPYTEEIITKDSADFEEIRKRLDDLEARISTAEAGKGALEPALNGKQSALLVTEVRRAIQPDLDALNRAVRRYEKRATLQAFQTESRLLDLEARLADAISLAAVAANSNQRQKGFTGILLDWSAAAIVLPLQAIGSLAKLPFKTIVALIHIGKANVSQTTGDKRKSTNGEYPAHRVQGRVGGKR